VPLLVIASRASIEELTTRLTGEDAQGVILALEDRESGRIPDFMEAVMATWPSDVVLLLPGVRVVDGWVSRLRDAAMSDTTIATATPLQVAPGYIETLEHETGHAMSLEQAARRIAARSTQARPKIRRIGNECVYIRRAALDLVDLPGSLPLGETLDRLGSMLASAGLVHVVADDVLVANTLSVPRGREDAIEEGEDEKGRQFPRGQWEPLRRAGRLARAAIGVPSVTIDARALTAAVGGTQTYITQLILALAGRSDVHLRVLTPPDLPSSSASTLLDPGDLELVTYEQAIADPRPTDIVHRPQQVFTLADLALLRLVGERVVVGQQDLIAYHNFSYHEDLDSWGDYRRATRLALASADQVVFFSDHARRDALAEDLLPALRAHVVGVGGEQLQAARSPASRPAGVEADVPFVLCLGADYAHKNRPFAIELVRALREAGWRGHLILAGPHVHRGSSREQERALLLAWPDSAECVRDLGSVDDPSREWLYRHARALLYPTVYEGFGLLPFEAARAGLPCLFAAQASLAEIAEKAATLVPWDARASAQAVLPLLCDGPERDAHLAELRDLPVPRWSDIAQRMVDVYWEALASPPPEAAPRLSEELERESRLGVFEEETRRLTALAQEYQDAYHSLHERVRRGLPLIDEGGLLTPSQQRGLMRVAGRGRLGGLALSPLGLLGRLAGEGPCDPDETDL
jgi:glycosyltransferase involved in cell wall biosynthesis